MRAAHPPEVPGGGGGKVETWVEERGCNFAHSRSNRCMRSRVLGDKRTCGGGRFDVTLVHTLPLREAGDDDEAAFRAAAPGSPGGCGDETSPARGAGPAGTGGGKGEGKAG